MAFTLARKLQLGSLYRGAGWCQTWNRDPTSCENIRTSTPLT